MLENTFESLSWQTHNTETWDYYYSADQPTPNNSPECFVQQKSKLPLPKLCRKIKEHANFMG